MNIGLYEFGLQNTLEAIEEALGEALNTNNKKEKARYLGEAYGLVRAIDMLISETEEVKEKRKKTE